MHKITYIFLSVVLTVFVLALTVVTVIKSNQLSDMELKYENSLKASLRQATNDMRTVENDISKLMVTVNEYSRVQLLSKIKEKSASCARELSRLPIVATGVQNTLKFSNQISAYCDSTLIKYSDGEGLPENFDDQLIQFFSTCKMVNSELDLVEADVMNDHLLLLQVGDESISDGIFGSIDNDTVEYPSVIFDGPFSDGQARTTPKTEREEITLDQAKSKVQALGFNMEYKYEMNGVVPSYVFENENSTLEITKKGGLLLMLMSDRQVLEARLTDDEALGIACEFVERLNLGEFKSVWQEYYGNTIVFNLVPIKNNVVIYPDMLKVKVALDNGQVLSFEGKSYIMNSRERQTEQAEITKKEAEQKLKQGFLIEKSRLALISVNEREHLAWEFFGSYNDMKYVVYISAVDGKEKTCFRILNTETGEMVG
ncbi:MAG: germination protein YpeB [Clostridia bacterium]|nr:germination protein YpeB [Clostridia bacterium]